MPQAVVLGRCLGAHWPCALQVSWPEHSLAGDPHGKSVLPLKAVALRVGSQIWQTLPGFWTFAPKHVPPTKQPWHWQALTVSLQL
jgi:hypothetical protein